MDILKANHHGIVPLVPEFLDMTSPGFVFINNLDDGSASKLTGQLNYRKIPYFFDGWGAIVMETDGTDWYVEQHTGEFD